MTEKQKILALSATAAAAQSLIALVTNSFRIFFGVYGPYCVIGMLEIFFDYASRSMAGQVPYRDYLVEYPILGFVLFLIPRLFVSTFAGYRIAFGVMLLVFNAAAVFLVAQHVGRTEGIDRVRVRLAWYTAFFAGLCPLLMGPYDLAPMAVAFAAAQFWFGGRNALGGVMAGLGVLLKIFPGAVAAPALVWEVARLRETRGRGFLAFLATVAAGMAVWLWLGGRRVVDSLLYHTERGLLVESLYGGILMLYGKATGQRVTWVYDHKALHITADWGGSLARLSLPIQIAAILFVMWRFRKSGMKEGVRYAGASVLAFMVMGKVLSPQFVIWMIPFISVVSGATGRLARSIFLQACIVSTLIYPFLVLRFILEENAFWAIVILNYRNALLIGLLLVLLFGKGADRENALPSPSGSQS